MSLSPLRRSWPLVLALVPLIGCSPEPEDKKPQPEQPKTAEPVVTLEAVTFDELTQAIGSHRGKVVVVDVWASWCGPCLEEFPNLVQLHRDHQAEGLVCISASLDDTLDRELQAYSFLRQQKATFANYRCAESGGEWSAKFKIKSIPAVFVYNREGKLARKFPADGKKDERFDYEHDVAPLVRKLLKEK